MDGRGRRYTGTFVIPRTRAACRDSSWWPESWLIHLNVLFTYRVNAGTVFYGGYDDHDQQAEVFMKVQYLFQF